MNNNGFFPECGIRLYYPIPMYRKTGGESGIRNRTCLIFRVFPWA